MGPTRLEYVISEGLIYGTYNINNVSGSSESFGQL